MATLKIKKKLPANRTDCGREHPRQNLLRDTTFRRVNDDHITQVPEEVKGRVTKLLVSGV